MPRKNDNGWDAIRTPTPNDRGNETARKSAKHPNSQRSENCQWTEDENGPHETECGHAFEFTYDGVEANGFKYCCFCGGAIVLKLANDQAHRPLADSGTEL